jgi:hypothetical protein
MSHLDDYRDEMERLSSQEAEEVLSGGRPTTGAARGAAAVVERLRTELLSPPSPSVEERHLFEMRAAAGPDEPRRDPMRTNTHRKKRFASLGLAAALVLGAGLAGAITLPEQASEVAEQRIEELQPPVGPGEGGQDDVTTQDASDHGKAVSALAHDDSPEGCEKGRAVSDLASSKADDNRKNEGDRPGPCGPNGGGGGASASANRGANGNHGEGNRGKGNDANDLTSKGGNGGATAGDNRKNDLPHGTETAPGKNSAGALGKGGAAGGPDS